MSVRERVPAVLVCLLVVATIVPAAGAAAVPERGSGEPAVAPVTDAPAVGSVIAPTSPTVDHENNTTRRHSNPENAEESGDLAAVNRWLGGRMDEVLVDCTEGIEVGNYDACDRLDEDYPEWLGRYVEVSRRTNDESDDEAAEAYENARENQSEYADTVREFRQTYDEYQEARENGNTARARQLARELVRLGRQANATGSDLIRNYDTVTERGDADLTSSARTVEEINRNITETTEEVERQQFVRLDLAARVESERVSFTDPLAVSGQVTTENGTTLANQSVLILDDEQRVLNRTRTDETGAYTITYRPTIDPLGENTYTIVARPPEDSPYLGTNATVNATVEQVEPTVEVRRTPDSAGFNDTVTVSGEVTGPDEDAGAAGVPVVVTVGGEPIGRVATDDSGEFSLRTRLPATVAAGDREVRARLPLEEQALAAASATARPLEVTTSETDLTVSGAHVDGAEVRVTGRLTTADGEPVADQVVTVTLGDEPAVTTEVRTDSNGRYNATLTVPAEYGGDEIGEQTTVALRAVYDGGGTNLADATARTQVLLRTTQALLGGNRADGLLDRVGSWIDRHPGLAIGVGILLVAAVIGLVLGRRRLFDRPQPEAAAAVAGDEGGADRDERGHTTPDFEALLDLARSRLDAGTPADCVTTAYAAARTRLQEAGTAAQTHWEFYRARRDDLPAGQAEALEQLTEVYERTQFGTGTPSRRTAEEALAAAEVVATGDGAAVRSDGSGPASESTADDPARDGSD